MFLAASVLALLLNLWKGYWNRVETPHATRKPILYNFWAPLIIDVQMEQCCSQIGWQVQKVLVQMATSQDMKVNAVLRTCTASHVEAVLSNVFSVVSSRSFGKAWIHFPGSSILSVRHRTIRVSLLCSFHTLSLGQSSCKSRKYLRRREAELQN